MCYILNMAKNKHGQGLVKLRNQKYGSEWLKQNASQAGKQAWKNKRSISHSDTFT